MRCVQIEDRVHARVLLVGRRSPPELARRWKRARIPGGRGQKVRALVGAGKAEASSAPTQMGRLPGHENEPPAAIFLARPSKFAPPKSGVAATSGRPIAWQSPLGAPLIERAPHRGSSDAIWPLCNAVGLPLAARRIRRSGLAHKGLARPRLAEATCGRLACAHLRP